MTEAGIDFKNLVKEFASLKKSHSKHQKDSKKIRLQLEDDNTDLRYKLKEALKNLRKQ